MSRINTNVSSMLAQRVLNQQNKAVSTSLERLSTGLRINRGKDDPAGLIGSENLRAEKAAITAAIGNGERADQVVNIAEGGLIEVSNLLTELESLVGQSANDAGLNAEEKAANQLQIDSVLQTIDRIANSTSFEGVKLLNGGFDFTVDSQHAEVREFQINAAKLQHDDTKDVQVLVTQSAQHGAAVLSTGGALDLTDADSRLKFELAGAQGSREFVFASGETLANIAVQINTFTSVTGVSAAVSSDGNSVVLKSNEFGADQFVSVQVLDDGGQTGGVYGVNDTDENTADSGKGDTLANLEGSNPYRDEGQDVGAIINGVSATSDGARIRTNTDVLDLEMLLSDTGAQTLTSFKAMTVTGGGAKFNLGPRIDIFNQSSIGIQDVSARKLGDVVNGFLSELSSGSAANVEDGDLEKAQKIVRSSIEQVSSLRGRLGAFQKNTIASTIRSLGIALENTAAAESQIRDTDFAEQTAELTRSQILSQAATNALGLANSNPQQVLQLLG